MTYCCKRNDLDRSGKNRYPHFRGLVCDTVPHYISGVRYIAQRFDMFQCHFFLANLADQRVHISSIQTLNALCALPECPCPYEWSLISCVNSISISKPNDLSR